MARGACRTGSPPPPRDGRRHRDRRRDRRLAHHFAQRERVCSSPHTHHHFAHHHPYRAGPRSSTRCGQPTLTLTLTLTLALILTLTLTAAHKDTIPETTSEISFGLSRRESASSKAGMEACVEAAPRVIRVSAALSAAERWRAAAKQVSELLGLRGPGERLCHTLRLHRHGWDLPPTRRPSLLF